MHILVDIGNTNILFGKVDNLNLVEQLRIETKVFDKDISKVDSETYTKIHNFIGNDCSDFFISGVVPDTILILINFMKNFQDLNIVEIDNKYLGNLIKVDVDMPDEVGVDRLINSYAGLNLYNGPLIIIDFGTATTFDIVKKGSYVGGVISPGINLSILNLHKATALLPKLILKKKQRSFGKNTQEALNAGFLWGYEGLINNIIKKIVKNSKNKYKIILTGGHAVLFKKFINKNTVIDQNITIKGIATAFREIL